MWYSYIRGTYITITYRAQCVAAERSQRARLPRRCVSETKTYFLTGEGHAYKWSYTCNIQSQSYHSSSAVVIVVVSPFISCTSTILYVCIYYRYLYIYGYWAAVYARFKLFSIFFYIIRFVVHYRHTLHYATEYNNILAQFVPSRARPR